MGIQPLPQAGPDEIEFRLAVIGEDPSGTLEAVLRLHCLARFRLGPPTQQAIHDRYWDRSDRALGDRRISLRVRQLDGRRYLTLKHGGTAADGLFRRRELEVPADLPGWLDVRDALTDPGIDPGPDPSGPPTAGLRPEDWLTAAGLGVVQERLTHRVVRQALRGDLAVAELALDRTEYRLDPATVEYVEIEVEELPAAGEVARGLGEALLATLPGRLERATESKYARGRRLAGEVGNRQELGQGTTARAAPDRSDDPHSPTG